MEEFQAGAGEVYDADSVAALIVCAPAAYLLQQRDDRPDVDFGGFAGLFGGAVDSGESAQAALLRELEEELAFTPSRVDRFATLEFDERAYGGWRCRRTYFEIEVKSQEISAMTLREGTGMVLAQIAEIRAMRVIPYDLCALLMYERKDASISALAAHRSRKVTER